MGHLKQADTHIQYDCVSAGVSQVLFNADSVTMMMTTALQPYNVSGRIRY